MVSDTQGQDTQTHIMAQQDRKGVLSEEAALTTIRTVAKIVKLKQKYLFRREELQNIARQSKGSLISKKHNGQTDRTPNLVPRAFPFFKGKALGTRLTVPEGYTQALFG